MGHKPAHASRFTEANTKCAVQGLQQLATQQVIARRELAESTKADRTRALKGWNDYMAFAFKDESRHRSTQVWQSLAGGDVHEQKQAMDVCKSYFKALIRSSVKPVTVWGPEETCLVQSITTVSALNTHWKTLLGAVQESVLGVLAAKTGRRQFVQRLHGPVGATDTGPAAQITQWIGTDLKEEFGLTVDSEYEKVATTCKDIEQLLRTLWERADDVPMSPQNRVSLHLYLLILYVSGCRPGMLQGIKWSDFTLYLMLDPDVPGKRRLVADLHLRFNKLKKNAVLLSTERLSFTFSTTLLPTLLLDLPHLLAAKALRRDAFKANFRIVDEMLNRPHLDAGSRTVLEWKPDLLAEHLSTMNVVTFRKLFKRLCLVAGLETPPRPYFLRVGAGANFEDRGMPSALQCRILSHSEKIYNMKYQALRVR